MKTLTLLLICSALLAQDGRRRREPAQVSRGPSSPNISGVNGDVSVVLDPAKAAAEAPSAPAKAETAKPQPIPAERFKDFDALQIRYLLAENKRLAYAVSQEEIPKGMTAAQVVAIYEGVLNERNRSWTAYAKAVEALRKEFGGDGWDIDPATKEWTKPRTAEPEAAKK